MRQVLALGLASAFVCAASVGEESAPAEQTAAQQTAAQQTAAQQTAAQGAGAAEAAAQQAAAQQAAAQQETSPEPEADEEVVVTAERLDKRLMSIEDMEFVHHVAGCGAALYEDGQEAEAWPYLRLAARYGDVDSQFWVASMLRRGEHVPRNWTEAVGWLGVATEGNVKPGARRLLDEAKESICGRQAPRAECEARFDAIVVDYRERFGRKSPGSMSCRYIKGQVGGGVSSLRINPGLKRVQCRFPAHIETRDILDDEDLQSAVASSASSSAVPGGSGGEPAAGAGAGAPGLAASYTGRIVHDLGGNSGSVLRRGQIRCPKL